MSTEVKALPEKRKTLSESTPKKKPKSEDSKEVLRQEFRPTFKEEVSQPKPSVFQHLGYMNRNVRPVTGRTRKLLETQKLLSSREQKAKREQEKIEQFKKLLDKKT